MKTFKTSCRKVKIYISPQGGKFQFSARGERYVYLKKISPWGEFHLALTSIQVKVLIHQHPKINFNFEPSKHSSQTFVLVKKC